MSAKEEFPISEEILNKFISVNEKRWNKGAGTGKKNIYINLSMVRMQNAWLIPKILFAKGIQEKTGDNIIALTWRNNKSVTRYMNSFGVEHVAINDLCKKDFSGFLKALFKTIAIVLFDKNSEAIKQVKTFGINVGKDLYEDILRTSSLSTIHTCRNKIVIRKMLHIIWAMYSIKKFEKKNPGSFALVDDYAYHEGALIKEFRKLGMRVYQCNNWRSEDVVFDSEGDIIRIPTRTNMKYHDLINAIDDSAVKWTDSYLEARFAGKNGREIDRGAFADKKLYTREIFEKEYGLDPSKKTVVIMAHTFTDAVYNYGNYCFKDYYSWTKETLKLASSNDKVNWILKPHPTRNAYNEDEDSIENLFEKYKKSNMFFMGDNVSAESIKNVADVIVTIGGNAGAEFACFGVPSVIIGRPYYAGFGYTIDVKDYNEYKKILSEIEKIEKLDDDKIITAKKVFYLRYIENEKYNSEMYFDETSKYINDMYYDMVGKMAIAYFKSNSGTKEYNDNILEKWMEYIEIHDEKESDYYKRGIKAASS